MSGLFGFWALEEGTEGLIWRADLPADPAQASAFLNQADASLADMRKAITSAEGRLRTLLNTLPSQPGGSARVTRGILPGPERAVLALLTEARARETAPGAGLESQPPEGWPAAVDEFQTFITWVEASLSKDTQVETRIDGQLIAQTQLSAQGDLQTTWLEEASGAHRAIHQRSLQAAREGLLLMVQALAMNARIASKLSGQIEDAAGSLVVMPPAWQFILQIRSEHQP